jgi:hypothetical protein
MDIKTIKALINKLATFFVLFGIVVVPQSGVLFQHEKGYLSTSQTGIFTYDNNLRIKSYYMRTPRIRVGNFSFDVLKNIPYKTQLYGDTLVIYSTITDTVEVYLYNSSCIRKLKNISLPILKKIKSQDNKLIASAHGKEIDLEIYTSTDTDILHTPHVEVYPTIDNIALHNGTPPVITDTSTTYHYKKVPLHIGEDLYISGKETWYTRDHIIYQETQTGSSIITNDPIWFVDNIAITATISHFWGPIYTIYIFHKDIETKKHKILFDDWTLARKAKKLTDISIGGIGNDIFIAFSATNTTIFAHYKYDIESRTISYEGMKTFPDKFIVRGSYAMSPISGYIMKLGTWSAPIPPSPNITNVLISIPFIVTDQYLDTLNIRWCRDE